VINEIHELLVANDHKVANDHNESNDASETPEQLEQVFVPLHLVETIWFSLKMMAVQ
jgi:hypothetical protein